MSGSIGFSPISLYTTYEANETARAAANLKSNPQASSLAAYFAKVAPKLTSPAALLKDTKALTVVLAAFNLSSSINDTAILKKLLTQDPTSKTSLAHTLGGVKYLLFANALSNWTTPPFASKSAVSQIVNSYSTNLLEQHANTQATGLANALYFTREAPSLKSVVAIQSDSNLLSVVVTGLGLPLDNFNQLGFDQQTALLTSKLHLANLQNPAYVKQVAEQYLVSQQATANNAPALGSTASLYSDSNDTTGDSLLSILNPATGPDSAGGSGGFNVLSLFA